MTFSKAWKERGEIVERLGFRLTLTFPMPPNIANARMHWRVKQKAKKEFWDLCSWHELVFKWKRPAEPFGKARISSVMYLFSEMDYDNAMSRHKWIQDWLKDAGYIVDDKRKNLEWTSFPVQKIDRKNQRIEITLEAA